MSKRTKITAIVIVIAAAAIIAAGATLAYFTADGGTKTNTFSTGSVTVELREPTWDGYNFGDPHVSDGQSAASNDPSLGFNQAQKYGPGDVISKDPQVKNTDKVVAWVAIKVNYSLNGGPLTYSDFQSKLLTNNGLDFDLSNWTLLKDEGTNGQLYLYKTKLEKDQTTGKLFTKVPIAFGGLELIDGKLPTFAIDAQGFGVQAENITPEKAQEELINLAFN